MRVGAPFCLFPSPPPNKQGRVPCACPPSAAPAPQLRSGSNASTSDYLVLDFETPKAQLIPPCQVRRRVQGNVSWLGHPSPPPPSCASAGS